MTTKGEPIFDGEKYGYDQSYINLGDASFWRKRLNDVFRQGHKSGKLLDIGCNYGFFLRACEPYFDTYGVDISQYAIFQAKRYAFLSDIILHEVEEGLPFNDETFDVVTMFDILEHLKNYEKTLKDVYRILKPGGVFLLTTPNRWSMDSILFGKDYWFRRDSSHVVLFSKDSLRETLLKAGFSQTKIRTISLLHFLWEFCRRSSSSRGNSVSHSSHRDWAKRILESLKPALKEVYEMINGVPTPWGANLYASCKKGWA